MIVSGDMILNPSEHRASSSTEDGWETKRNGTNLRLYTAEDEYLQEEQTVAQLRMSLASFRLWNTASISSGSRSDKDEDENTAILLFCYGRYETVKACKMTYL